MFRFHSVYRSYLASRSVGSVLFRAHPLLENIYPTWVLSTWGRGQSSVDSDQDYKPLMTELFLALFFENFDYWCTNVELPLSCKISTPLSIIPGQNLWISGSKTFWESFCYMYAPVTLMPVRTPLVAITPQLSKAKIIGSFIFDCWWQILCALGECGPFQMSL